MRREKKWVYYCDFCKKRGLRSLKTHEARCTLNPDRTCRLCKEKLGYRVLVDKLPFTTKDAEVGHHCEVNGADLMDLAQDCPICALTIFRLFLKKRHEDFWNIETDFDYKKELKAWWSDANVRSERDSYGY